MGEHGYDGASMRDMAARAGVSVAALYYHFPSKLALLSEFLEEAYDVILRRIDRRLAGAAPDPASQLDELVATLIASYTHDEFALRASLVALREYGRLPVEDRRTVDAKRERVVARAVAVIEAGARDGTFDSDDPVEAARAVVALCSTTVEVRVERAVAMADVIATHQRFARSIAGTRLHDDASTGSGRNGDRPG